MAADDTKLKELTSPQRKAIAYLLVSRNVEEAAKASGISERTLYRWLADEHFYSVLAREEGNAIDYATRRLIVLADSAIDVIKTIIEDEAAPRSIRLRASLGALAELRSMRDLRSLEARITALEAIYEAQTQD